MTGQRVPVFKRIFDGIASTNHGCLGDPSGETAAGYLRVSTDRQNEGDKSGMDRQVEAVHNAARREHLRIDWDHIYWDDESGYRNDRPGIDQLLTDTSEPTCGFSKLVIEAVDRFSRGELWQAGYLLSQFRVRDIEVVFWEQVHSELEMGIKQVIAHEGMNRMKKAMREGKRLKAKRGCVTACSKPAFGFKKVDGYGEVSERTSSDTHYISIPEEAEIVRWIFKQIAGGKSLRATAIEAKQTFPLIANRKWDATIMLQMVQNTAYKGVFYGHRFSSKIVTKVGPDGKITERRHSIKLPESEWILAEGAILDDPIVSPQLWELANDMLKKNKRVASRNGKHEYLLTGLLKCAHCGYAWNGFVSHKHRVSKKKGKVFDKDYWLYRCTSLVLKKERKAFFGIECHEPIVRQEILDDAVWQVVRNVMQDPTILIQNLDDAVNSKANQELLSKIQYNKDVIEKLDEKISRVNDGYEDGFYSREEAKDRKEKLATQIKASKAAIEDCEAHLIRPEDVEIQKKAIMEMAEMARQYELDINAPFQVKKAVIRAMVDDVRVSSSEGTFSVSGHIKGTWPLVIKQIRVEMPDRKDVLSPEEVNEVVEKASFVFDASRCTQHNIDTNIPYEVKSSLEGAVLFSKVFGRSSKAPALDKATK